MRQQRFYRDILLHLKIGVKSVQPQQAQTAYNHRSWA
jgi:hypothetical protein